MFDFKIENLNISQETIECIKSIFKSLGWILFGILFILVVFFIDKIERFVALIYKILSKIFKTIPWIHKKYIKHDFQSSINNFSNGFIKNEIKGFKPINIKVDWVDENQIPESFLKEGKLIVRMKKNSNDNKNFVNAVMVFISESVLPKAKKYISKKQRESIDLYVAKKMFDKKNEDIAIEFVQDYLQPKMEDEKIDNFFAKYEGIDKAGLFFPVFIQEMIFLGNKVFNNRRDDSIIIEVTNLINFLDRRASKKVGQDMDGRFFGEYCKFAVVLVGKVDKIYAEGVRPYKKCIERFIKSGSETLYLVGDIKNKDFIKDFVCNDEFLGEIDFKIFNEKKYTTEICNKEKCWKNDNYLLVVRKNKINHYFQS